MSYRLRFNFDLARTGYMVLAASAFSAFAATADAQQNVDTPDFQQLNTDRAKTGDREQNSMIPHFQFFEYMHNPENVSCCHMDDGITDVLIEPNDDPNFPLKVKLTHTRFGLQLENPMWVRIPKRAILTPDHAQEVCEPYIERAEAAEIEHTCTPPSFSAIWIEDYTTFYGEQHRLGDGRVVPQSYIVPPEEYQPADGITIYCVWEAPQF